MLAGMTNVDRGREGEGRRGLRVAEGQKST